MSWRRFIHRRWWDEERAREIDTYLETETADNIARGMSHQEASAAARRKFGNPGLVREEIYRMNTIGWLESTWQDIRYGLRVLRLSPGFAAVAILSLALGMGANTAIFQLLDAVRLRALPVVRPRELVEVRIAGGNHGFGLNQQYGELTRPIWNLFRDRQQVFSGTFAWSIGNQPLGSGSETRHFNQLSVSGDFFTVLGVRPFAGRLLGPRDEVACPSSAAVASYAYWQSELGGRDISSGIKLQSGNEPLEIVGVTPPEFLGMVVGQRFDLARPFCRPKDPLRSDVFDLSVVGRLKPGETMERASAAVGAMSPDIFEATVPPGREPRSTAMYKQFRLTVDSASGGVSELRDSYDTSLYLLLGITGLVLLIACVNLANLMLARASTRGREIAVRLALGASRGRLLRQLLAESALVAAAGAALGLALAETLSRFLVWAITPAGGGIILPLAMDWRVFLFAGGAALSTCLIFGVLPALRASRMKPSAAMKAGGRGQTAGPEHFSMQRVMVVTQISVCLLLMVAALLFVRSFRNIMTFNPGMRESGVTFAFLGFGQSNLPPERWMSFERELLAELQSTPGVESAATTTNVPLWGGSWGHTVHIGSSEGPSKFTWVSPDYFTTMSIPVLRGRPFNANDSTGSPKVAVVNQAFARALVPGLDPIGMTVRTAPEPNYPSSTYQIVGVIADTRYDSIKGDMPPQTFAPASQFPAQGPWTCAMIHSGQSSASLIATLKHRLSQKYPGVNVEFYDFQKGIYDRLLQERLMALLSGFFGALAALLAMVGLYGVISYMVARRRNEIGIRLALGAGRSQVVAMVMREAARLLAIGIVLGALAALLAGRSAGSLLFGLKPYDPLTLVSAGLLLALIAAAASFVPARRAARLDPMAALRDE